MLGLEPLIRQGSKMELLIYNILGYLAYLTHLTSGYHSDKRPFTRTILAHVFSRIIFGITLIFTVYNFRRFCLCDHRSKGNI